MPLKTPQTRYYFFVVSVLDQGVLVKRFIFTTKRMHWELYRVHAFCKKSSRIPNSTLLFLAARSLHFMSFFCGRHMNFTCCSNRQQLQKIVSLRSGKSWCRTSGNMVLILGWPRHSSKISTAVESGIKDPKKAISQTKRTNETSTSRFLFCAVSLLFCCCTPATRHITPSSLPHTYASATVASEWSTVYFIYSGRWLCLVALLFGIVIVRFF